MTTGRIIGTADHGACGICPLVELPIHKPRMRNNGYNCYVGHPEVYVPGLRAVLRDGDREGQGHVEFRYRGGGSFFSYVSDYRREDRYRPC